MQGIVLEVMLLEDVAEVYDGGVSCLLYKGNRMEALPDFVIMREYETVLSRHFELAGVPVINTAVSMMLCRNKALTHQLMTEKGIPSPRTIYNAASLDYPRAAALLGGNMIVKKTDGSKGENVYLVGSGEQYEEAVRECGGNAIAQQFIENSYGRDVRVWTIGGRAIAAVERYSESSFLSNYSQGGKVKPFPLTDQAAALAERASRAVGAEFAGVDLLFGRKGMLVNEVNGNAGFRTLSRVGKNTIPRELFRYVAEKLKEK